MAATEVAATTLEVISKRGVGWIESRREGSWVGIVRSQSSFALGWPLGFQLLLRLMVVGFPLSITSLAEDSLFAG